MRVLIDTNIIIDFLLKREPFYTNSKNALMKCTHSDIKGFIALHAISDLWYILRKETEENRRKFLKIICLALTVCFTNHQEVYNAINNKEFKDLEDCLQDSHAYVNSIDYIITRNTKDYKHSRVKAITPTEFVQMPME
jgi:predicted nucleic-acid-binding protein